jgi:3-methylfumaryl-CoA hydratase
MADARPFADAIGRREVQHDTLDLRQARHMQLALDQPATLSFGDALPPFWHYLYFNPQLRASELAADGHERLGRFLPDMGLPRRMWAGGRVEIARPLKLGQAVEKTTTITDIALKEGRSGRLGFVTTTHDFSANGAVCFTETQNIVYRDLPSPDTPARAGRQAPAGAAWSRRVIPDPVLLFRYSALIFYGHRIHYDADYTRQTEGYPRLVVHGPLTATLLIGFGLEQAAGRRLTAVNLRAMAPLFAPDPVILEGKPEGDTLAVWARKEDGTLAMTVTLEFASTDQGSRV